MTDQMIDLLSQLLIQLSAQDNQIRKEAELQLDKHWVLNQPAHLLVGLSHLTLTHSDIYLRSFAAILLRRYSLKETQPGISLLEKSGPEALSEIQKSLLSSLQNEPDRAVRNKVADACSQIAKLLLEKKVLWNELFQVCIGFLSTQNPMLRNTFFLVFNGCPKLLTKQDQNSLKAVFGAGLQDPDTPVRLTALRASISYLIICKNNIRNEFADILPLILNVIPPILSDSTKDENDAIDGITSIIELATAYPKMFKTVLPNIVDFMISQMKNKALEDGTRQMCLELLITLCEGAPGMMRKHAPFAPAIIPVVLDWMSELEDEPEWYNGENIEDEDEASNETAGEQSMDRLAIYLGGNVVLPIAFNLIPAMLASPDWNRRHAALRCISAIGEGCHKFMSEELGKVVHVILPHMRDPHPRVRHAACNAIGQMCTDFSPSIQMQFHQEILSNLIPIMSDLVNIRVANYASAALVNFSETASKELLEPYIETIIEKLLALMNTGKLFVQEQAVTSLATVADSAGPGFTKFYGRIMSVMLQILSIPSQKEFRSLKGKTLECSSLIILAVGKDIFSPDAVGFIKILQDIQAGIVDADDPQSSYLLSAWARVCKVLGLDFAPYLETVLPPLLQTAALQPKMVSFEAEDDIGAEYTENEGWEIMSVGEKNLAIKTSVLDDKCTAVEMLVCYAQEMGPLFHMYVERISLLVTPMFKFYLHDGVRVAAADLVPVLLQCWIQAEYPTDKVSTLWQGICGKLVEAITEEDDLSVLCTFYTSLCAGIKNIGAASMSPENMQKLITHLIEQLEQFLIRNRERQSQRQGEDYDVEDEDALQEEEFDDDTFLGDASSTISQLFKTFKGDFLVYFDQLLSKVNEFAACLDTSSRQWALCIYCDLIEYTGQGSVPYQGYFLQFFAQSLNDQSSDVRQAACYGVGAAAKYGGPTYGEFCMASVPHLLGIINQPQARSEEDLMATENAISAIGKIIRTYMDSTAFDSASIISFWIEALPIVEDAEEAPETYKLLLDLINMQNAAVVNEQKAPKLVSILSKVLAVPTILPNNPEIRQQLSETLRSIISVCDRQKLPSLLDPESQQFLSSQGFI